MELLKDEAPAPSEAAEEPVVKGPITIALTALKETIANTIANGLTPLIVDSSKEHAVDTFFSYSGVMIDVKQLSLNVSMKKITKEDALEKAREGFVSSMQNGRTMVVSMQQGSPSFNDWFNTPTEWPIEAIATKAGKPLTIQSEKGEGGDEGNAKSEYGNGIPKAVMREKDLAKHHGFAVVQESFEIVFTTWFSVEDYEEFLFDEGRGLSKLNKDLFQVIIIKEDEA